MTLPEALDQRFADAMGQLLGPGFPKQVALAVSGGGDSMAMLTLAHNWARVWGVGLHVVTVDHGLRPESADEAAMVARECALLGHPHTTLRWHWDGAGNKMDAARRARLSLIEGWRGGIRHVLMAHTRDDVAETFLMRLKRGSGLDGLAAMEARRRVPGSEMEIIRPCLEMSRDELRHHARVLKTPWVEDPSNEDPRYDRARIRQALEILEEEGLDRATLAATAHRLRQDREVARLRAADLWRKIGEQLYTPEGGETGILMLKPDWARFCEEATQRRILSVALRFISSRDYAPRAEALEQFRDLLTSGGAGTLHGCDVTYLKGHALIFREYAAVSDKTAIVGRDSHWDNRWRIDAPGHVGCTVRALGEDGWRQIGEKPPHAHPFRAALSLPSLWEDDRLVACDALGFGPGHFTPRDTYPGQPFFHRFLLTH